MEDAVQTWHHGLMARHWAENNTTGPEIAYYQRQIEQYGQPALDAGCGTGRLLIPFLRAGLDVDGIDVSVDMLAYCRQTAAHEGLSPRLYRQALHTLDLPRRYRTIIACGIWGIGVSRQNDFESLQRFYDHLLPGGMLVLEGIPAYGDADLWPLWRKDARGYLPEPWPQELGDRPKDSKEYELWYRNFYLTLLQKYGHPVLDVGCGTGRLLLDYVQLGIDIDGVDNSPEMLAICQQKADELGCTVNLFEHMEILKLPRQHKEQVCLATGQSPAVLILISDDFLPLGDVSPLDILASRPFSSISICCAWALVLTSLVCLSPLAN